MLLSLFIFLELLGLLIRKSECALDICWSGGNGGIEVAGNDLVEVPVVAYAVYPAPCLKRKQK